MLFKSLNAKCQSAYTITGPRPRCALANHIMLYTILGVLLGMFMPAQAMLYRPEKGVMWDPSVIWHEGKYYAFMMYNKDGRKAGEAKYCLLASSPDGVHWNDEGIVNEEREPLCRFFKCFVARCGDKFIMNHGVSRPKAQDTLRFYESSDLKNWNHLFSSNPDPKWYVPTSRWDHMYMIPKEEGKHEAGYWGYVVATPKEAPGVGMMQSVDGLEWEVLPPASIEWPQGIQPRNYFEWGGCERIGDKYYLIGGGGKFLGNSYSMYTLVADSPLGPFRFENEAYRLCGTSYGKSPKGSSKSLSWLAAWARVKDELLISNYASFSFTDKDSPVLLPLRKPVVGKDGHLRLGWWKGNEALKGKPFKLKKKTVKLKTQPKKNNYKIVYLSEEFDLDKGLVLEGRIKARSAVSKRDSNDTASKMKPAAGFVFEEGPGKSMAIQLGIGKPEDRETHIGILEIAYEDKMQFQSEDVTGGKGCATVTGIDSGKKHSFRLLVRRGMFELYIDDMLMQTYVYEPGSGKVGFMANNANVVFSNVKAWNMSF